MFPAVAFLLLVFVYPFIYAIDLSIKDGTGAYTLANYIRFFTDAVELRTIWNTITISLPVVLSQGLIAEIWRSVYQNLNQFQYIRCGIDMKYFGFLAVMVAVFPLFAGKAYALTAKFGQERLLKVLFMLIAAGLFALTFTSNAVLSVILIVMITAAYPLCQPALEEIQQKSITGVNRATMMSIFALVMELAAAGENALVSSAAGISLAFGFSSLGILAIIAILLMFVYYRMSRTADVSGLSKHVAEAAE